MVELLPRWQAGAREFVIGAGTLFSGVATGLAAYRISHCAKHGGSCTPAWTAKGQYADITFAAGVVYASTVDGLGHGGVAAFDAAGTSSCSGTPKVCLPLWTWFDVSAASSSVGNLKVGNGMLWVSDVVFEQQIPVSSNLRAFDITLYTGCSGSTCNPVRSIATSLSDFAYTLGPQLVIVTDLKPAGMTVYDARTGAKKWRSTTKGYDATLIAQGRMIYVANSTSLRIEAYPINGGASCTGSPRSCPPAFLVPFAGGNVPTLAATPNLLFVNDHTDIRSYDATGTTRCFGPQRLCQPLYTYTAAGGDLSPVVANGVLYSSNRSSLDAFDATGATGCDQATRTCAALWTMTPQASLPGSLEVTGGALYGTSQNDTDVHAFTLAG